MPSISTDVNKLDLLYADDNPSLLLPNRTFSSKCDKFNQPENHFSEACMLCVTRVLLVEINIFVSLGNSGKCCQLRPER